MLGSPWQEDEHCHDTKFYENILSYRKWYSLTFTKQDVGFYTLQAYTENNSPSSTFISCLNLWKDSFLHTCVTTPDHQPSYVPPKLLLRRNCPNHSLIDHYVSEEGLGTAGQNWTERSACVAIRMRIVTSCVCCDLQHCRLQPPVVKALSWLHSLSHSVPAFCATTKLMEELLLLC